MSSRQLLKNIKLLIYLRTAIKEISDIREPSVETVSLWNIRSPLDYIYRKKTKK